ncbi:MAG: DegT/DnrJ/EryC1/StrS family aminotransferase, partial [Deltaproteobacteria bacterium]
MIGGEHIPRHRPAAVAGLWLGLLGTLTGARGDDDDIAAFERSVADVTGMPHAVVFASARAGIATSLRRGGVARGQVVVIPSYTAPCVPALLRGMGARVR